MYVGSRQELPSDLSIWNGSTVPDPVISGLTAHRGAISPIERRKWALSCHVIVEKGLAFRWSAARNSLTGVPKRSCDIRD